MRKNLDGARIDLDCPNMREHFAKRRGSQRPKWPFYRHRRSLSDSTTPADYRYKIELSLTSLKYQASAGLSPRLKGRMGKAFTAVFGKAQCPVHRAYPAGACRQVRHRDQSHQSLPYPRGLHPLHLSRPRTSIVGD